MPNYTPSYSRCPGYASYIWLKLQFGHSYFWELVQLAQLGNPHPVHPQLIACKNHPIWSEEVWPSTVKY